MKREDPRLLHGLVCVGALLLAATPALAARFGAQLDPVPFDAVNRATVIGSIGKVTAALDGDTLTIRGQFSNLSSPATGGSVRIGLAEGVPGPAVGPLTVEHARAGGFSGSIKLNADQAAAMRKQALYVRIDSERAPDGDVQGWLEGTD